MKIEVMYPEICNLYGELANISYLGRCIPEAEIIETGINDEPSFVSEKPDLIYMGSTTEEGQSIAIEKLAPFKERIQELIDDGANFLITGNALEIFGSEIIEDDKHYCDCLGIFPFVTKRSSIYRFNCLYLADFDPGDGEADIKIVGFKSQFGHSYGDNSDCYLFTTEKGAGLNPDNLKEGIRVNNFYATYVIGPLLILNPPFLKWYMRTHLGIANPQIVFEDAAMDVYNRRLSEYSEPDRGTYYL